VGGTQQQTRRMRLMLSIDGTDGQTDGRTDGRMLDHFINPAAQEHNYAASVNKKQPDLTK